MLIGPFTACLSSLHTPLHASIYNLRVLSVISLLVHNPPVQVVRSPQLLYYVVFVSGIELT